MRRACVKHGTSLGQEVCWFPSAFAILRLIAAVEKQPIVLASGEQAGSAMSTTAASMSVARWLPHRFPHGIRFACPQVFPRGKA